MIEEDLVSSRIKVCARLRPTIREDENFNVIIRIAPEVCASCKNDGQSIQLNRDSYDRRVFTLDHVFNIEQSNEEVYRLSLSNIVNDVVINGFNGSAIAYGQTGSGKTYTMFGNDQNTGLIQLAVYEIYKTVKLREKKGLVSNIIVSIFQVYTEQVYDLLANSKQDIVKPLSIRENPKDGTYLENITCIPVKNEESLLMCINKGFAYRISKSTTQNAKSSRSHIILKLFLDFEDNNTNHPIDMEHSYSDNNNEILCNEDCNISNNYKKYYQFRRRILTFVDLAGSERYQKSKSNDKIMQKESTSINKSISALGNCIQALAVSCSKKGYQHIPFRDSKLTRLLADSLGGNSKTLIMACVSPCSSNVEESLSTLQFALRAMRIQTPVRRSNEVFRTDHAEWRHGYRVLPPALSPLSPKLPEAEYRDMIYRPEAYGVQAADAGSEMATTALQDGKKLSLFEFIELSSSLPTTDSMPSPERNDGSPNASEGVFLDDCLYLQQTPAYLLDPPLSPVLANSSSSKHHLSPIRTTPASKRVSNLETEAGDDHFATLPKPWHIPLRIADPAACEESLVAADSPIAYHKLVRMLQQKNHEIQSLKSALSLSLSLAQL